LIDAHTGLSRNRLETDKTGYCFSNVAKITSENHKKVSPLKFGKMLGKITIRQQCITDCRLGHLIDAQTGLSRNRPIKQEWERPSWYPVFEYGVRLILNRERFYGDKKAKFEI